MIRLIADENFPFPSIQLLREAGYDVLSVSENFSSFQDPRVLELAEKENRLLLTFDRDFGELIVRHGYKPKSGIIYLRIAKFSASRPGEVVKWIIEKSELSLQNRITVYDGFIRQRDY